MLFLINLQQCFCARNKRLIKLVDLKGENIVDRQLLMFVHFMTSVQSLNWNLNKKYQ